MKSILIAAIAALAVVASAQSIGPGTKIDTITTFSGSIKKAQISEVVSQRIYLAQDIFGLKGTYLDFRGFGGFDFTAHNAPGAGAEAVGYFNAAKGLQIGIGPVGEFVQQNKATWGVALDFHVTAGTTSAFDFGFAPSEGRLVEKATYSFKF